MPSFDPIITIKILRARLLSHFDQGYSRLRPQANQGFTESIPIIREAFRSSGVDIGPVRVSKMRASSLDNSTCDTSLDSSANLFQETSRRLPFSSTRRKSFFLRWALSAQPNTKPRRAVARAVDARDGYSHMFLPENGAFRVIPHPMGQPSVPVSNFPARITDERYFESPHDRSSQTRWQLYAVARKMTQEVSQSPLVRVEI